MDPMDSLGAFVQKNSKVANPSALLNSISRDIPMLAALKFGTNLINRELAQNQSNIAYSASVSEINNSRLFALYDDGFYDVSQAMAARAVIEDSKSIGTVASPTDVDQPDLFADTARDIQLAVISAQPATIKNAISTFEKYGYMVNRSIVPPRLDVMSEFSYWQTVDTTILGSMPAEDRNILSAEFEAGVTLWEDMSLIGTNPTNTPVAGVTY